MILSKGIAKHIRQVHEVDQRVICHLCGKVKFGFRRGFFEFAGLSNKNQREIAFFRYFSVRKYLNDIQICSTNKVSSNIHMHKYHVRSDHEVHERLQCDICKEWYKNKENLRSHMKSIHVEGPKTCSICGRTSTNMKALAKHKKIHLEGSKERFKCIVCGKGFRDRTKLKVRIHLVLQYGSHKINYKIKDTNLLHKQLISYILENRLTIFSLIHRSTAIFIAEWPMLTWV